MKKRIFTGLFLPILLTLSLGVRIYGVHHGYPVLVSGDERPVCKNGLRFLVLNTLEPEHFNYPELYSYLFGGALYLYYLAGGLWQLGDLSSSAGFTWFFDPVEVALVGRLLSLLMGVGTVAVTFLIGRRAYGERVAAGAALFAAFSSLLIQQSRFALPDVTMTFFASVASLFLIGIAQRGDRLSYLTAGFFIGLATSTKYNGGMLLCGLLASHLVHPRSRPDWKGILNLGILLALGALLLGFLLGSPYWLLSFSKYYQALRYEQANVQFSLQAGNYPWLSLLSGLWSTEMIWGVLVTLGTIYALRRRTPSDRVLLAILLPTFLYIGSWPKGGLHYAIFLFPLLGILGARFALEIKGDSFARFAPLFLAAISLPNLWNGFQSGQNLSREDIRITAARWIESSIPDGTVVGVYSSGYYPPLKKTYVERRILREMMQTKSQHPEIVASLKALEEETSFYAWIDLEFSMDHLYVPPAYEQSVDIDNPKTRRIFSRNYLSYEKMKSRGVEYAILPEASYARFFTGETPPPGTAEHYHYTRNRDYIDQFFSSNDGRFELIREFKPRDGSPGSKISLFRVR
ncbi:MAG: phospholipid carrier-dependent glycosyltransferase [Gemmatimonadetes bacterium]|jgi:hypothetical protein|nr:phospholipid carrier-dependent glycosyltransferase [Gemmatimonadota bacterium]